MDSLLGGGRLVEHALRGGDGIRAHRAAVREESDGASAGGGGHTAAVFADRPEGLPDVRAR